MRKCIRIMCKRIAVSNRPWGGGQKYQERTYARGGGAQPKRTKAYKEEGVKSAYFKRKKVLRQESFTVSGLLAKIAKAFLRNRTFLGIYIRNHQKWHQIKEKFTKISRIRENFLPQNAKNFADGLNCETFFRQNFLLLK